MRLKHVSIVIKKEVKDIIRDRKTLLTSILLPMLLIPLFNILLGGGVEKFTKDMSENVTVALSETSNTPEIRQLLTESILKDYPEIKLVDIKSPVEAVRKSPVEAVRKEEARCVLDFESDYAQKLKDGKPFVIKLIYDKSKAKSEGSLNIISNAINKFNQKIVKERISALGQDPQMLEPARIEQDNVSDSSQAGNTVLMMTLPLMIGMLVALGGIPAATDLVAGEKERNTFEPLLTTKPDRSSLLMGKYLTTSLFSFVSVVAIVAGMVLGYAVNPNSLTMGSGAQLNGFSIPPLAAVLALVITVALGMTFSGVQIALSTYSKSFKEAQTYMSFLIFAAMVPGYATMFMQPGDIQTYMFTLPVLNTIAAMKMILGGVINYVNLFLALATSFVYVALTLWLAAAMFKKEKLLFRS